MAIFLSKETKEKIFRGAAMTGIVAGGAGGLAFSFTASLGIAGGVVLGMAGCLTGCLMFQLIAELATGILLTGSAAPQSSPLPSAASIAAPAPSFEIDPPVLKEEFDAKAFCRLQRDIPASKPPVFATAHKKGKLNA